MDDSFLGKNDGKYIYNILSLPRLHRYTTYPSLFFIFCFAHAKAKACEHFWYGFVVRFAFCSLSRENCVRPNIFRLFNFPTVCVPKVGGAMSLVEMLVVFSLFSLFKHQIERIYSETLHIPFVSTSIYDFMSLPDCVERSHRPCTRFTTYHSTMCVRL